MQINAQIETDLLEHVFLTGDGEHIVRLRSSANSSVRPPPSRNMPPVNPCPTAHQPAQAAGDEAAMTLLEILQADATGHSDDASQNPEDAEVYVMPAPFAWAFTH